MHTGFWRGPVKRHLGGEKALLHIPARTLRFWIAQYRLAKDKYGNGYVGLLPKTGAKGNRSSRLPEESQKLLTEFLATLAASGVKSVKLPPRSPNLNAYMRSDLLEPLRNPAWTG